MSTRKDLQVMLKECQVRYWKDFSDWPEFLMDEFGNMYWESERIPRVSDMKAGRFSEKGAVNNSLPIQKGRVLHAILAGEKDIECREEVREYADSVSPFAKSYLDSLLLVGYEILRTDCEEYRFLVLWGNIVYTGLRDLVLIHKERKIVLVLDWKTGKDYPAYDIQSFLYTLPEVMEYHSQGYSVRSVFVFVDTQEIKEKRVFHFEFDELQRLYDHLFSIDLDDEKRAIAKDLSEVLAQKLEIDKKEKALKKELLEGLEPDKRYTSPFVNVSYVKETVVPPKPESVRKGYFLIKAHKGA